MSRICNNIGSFEKYMAIILVALFLIYVPLKIYSIGFTPVDDANRHAAFATVEQNWSDSLIIEKGLESDHNAGWHSFLRVLHNFLGINKSGLLIFSSVSLFLLFNITGMIVSPSIGAWLLTLIIVFVAQKNFYGRMFCGRPFLLSCSATLILLRLWFITPSESLKKISKFNTFLISFLLLTICVWLHGSWYLFLILPFSLLIAGQIKKSLGLTAIIIFSTIYGALLTGDFEGFLRFHYSATLNIFTEHIYNWQLVTEFHEGNIPILWLIPAFFVIILLIKTKELKLGDLSNDPVFIGILLSWLLSIRVIRFWLDWGNVLFMFWFSYKISCLIKNMRSVKKIFFRWSLYLFILLSLAILIPKADWNHRELKESETADFSVKEFSSHKPETDGIVYNDSMFQYYFNYYENPKAKWRYVLGFEPAIMTAENKKTFREIVYSGFHFKTYEPWINKLTVKDRIFTTVDISQNYPNLDWKRVAKRLWIGKLPEKNE